MKCGGRGGRAGRRRIGIHGLVTRGVVRRREAAFLAGFDDIRWQRELADAVREGRHGLAGGEFEPHAVFALLGLDGDGAAAVDREAGFVRGALTWPQHAPPLERVGGGTQQQALDLAAGGPYAEEARLEDGDVITDQHRARGQQVREFGEEAVFDCARGATDDE